MSVRDDLAVVQRCIDDLCRTVGRLEQEVGDGLDVRRVRTDADHLRESIGLLRASAAEPGAAHRPEPVVVSDAPYDSSLWTNPDEANERDGLDDEGLGARDRHAP
ncbi:hypothetical protein GCM10018793_38460 [Streptomyces sulfonofaciens]|uniref:Uncharacterized protein n=1 Tax=Streptomyces sulfonofaciens TaxID=68272 RepID=A0A919L3H2_9ACTN|nr:hypothetical protein [Streptomyces sulfonofaciens]GHH81341.1 hypothetical protein GCM10018793_38460 [Streptomyces sulfonofaciens]